MLLGLLLWFVRFTNVEPLKDARFNRCNISRLVKMLLGLLWCNNIHLFGVLFLGWGVSIKTQLKLLKLENSSFDMNIETIFNIPISVDWKSKEEWLLQLFVYYEIKGEILGIRFTFLFYYEMLYTFFCPFFIVFGVFKFISDNQYIIL